MDCDKFINLLNFTLELLAFETLALGLHIPVHAELSDCVDLYLFEVLVFLALFLRVSKHFLDLNDR